MKHFLDLVATIFQQVFQMTRSEKERCLEPTLTSCRCDHYILISLNVFNWIIWLKLHHMMWWCTPGRFNGSYLHKHLKTLEEHLTCKNSHFTPGLNPGTNCPYFRTWTKPAQPCSVLWATLLSGLLILQILRCSDTRGRDQWKQETLQSINPPPYKS